MSSGPVERTTSSASRCWSWTLPRKLQTSASRGPLPPEGSSCRCCPGPVNRWNGCDPTRTRRLKRLSAGCGPGVAGRTTRLSRAGNGRHCWDKPILPAIGSLERGQETSRRTRPRPSFASTGLAVIRDGCASRVRSSGTRRLACCSGQKPRRNGPAIRSIGSCG